MPDPASEEIARIAEGLTEVQRWALSRIGDAPLAYDTLRGPLRFSMFSEGLLGCVDPAKSPLYFRLTPLGLGVRAYLQERG